MDFVSKIKQNKNKIILIFLLLLILGFYFIVFVAALTILILLLLFIYFKSGKMKKSEKKFPQFQEKNNKVIELTGSHKIINLDVYKKLTSEEKIILKLLEILYGDKLDHLISRGTETPYSLYEKIKDYSGLSEVLELIKSGEIDINTLRDNLSREMRGRYYPVIRGESSRNKIIERIDIIMASYRYWNNNSFEIKPKGENLNNLTHYDIELARLNQIDKKMNDEISQRRSNINKILKDEEELKSEINEIQEKIKKLKSSVRSE